MKKCLVFMLTFLFLAWFSHAASAVDTEKESMAKGPFQPTWESFAKNYECPEWFRDAKFGIWAHWGPQCLGGTGGHYAPTLYKEGGHPNIRHIQQFDHPSVFGFKDVCRAWTCEKWEPEKLMELYARAGARYFFSLGNHHDNFDSWNSKYQPWNSMNMGPKKDVVKIWGDAARKYGLRYGVSFHAWQAWQYFHPARGADKSGYWAGKPYDGTLTKADGKGTWWEGLDPQDLYAQNLPLKTADKDLPASYVENFCLRMKDVADSYHPDLMYIDNWDGTSYGGQMGMAVVAHYYNQSVAKDGSCQVVFNRKYIEEPYRKGMVWDLERGMLDDIQPYPWQIDTSIGDWFYKDGDRYKTAAQVIYMLADVVSKNGNMLLNIPLKGDGSIDPFERKFLEEMGDWMAINSESIHGTRPWKIFSDSTSATEKKKDYSFNEGGKADKIKNQIRFTRKGQTLYAIYCGETQEKSLTIKNLAKPSGNITNVSMLGMKDKLTWTQTDEGLVVQLPDQKPCKHAFVLKIEGQDLQPASRIAAAK